MYRIANDSGDSTIVWGLLSMLLVLTQPAIGWSQSNPVPAEQAVGEFELHPDCRIELVAAEPDVVDPVAIAFAPDGKLWVVEYSDYPNGPPENGPPLSRIRTLTDADGDGRYTAAVTFADKLLFANGLMLWQDGVIVTLDGSVTFMRDIDGDGQADEQTVWFRGFAKDNPQLRANHPTLGLDGHIYVASGLRGGEVIAIRDDWATDAKPVSLSGRDFRFDPFTGEYEAVSGPGQFGLCFDAFGNRFVCSNRNPCNHIVLEDRYLARNPHLAVSKVFHEVSPDGEKSKLYPISRTWTTSNLHANQFTAACGLLIYGGDALPQFRGNSFTCEPTGNLVHRDVLKPMGATFTSHYGREGVEFLASRDEWFRPVNLTHGPDGALYVVDMYRAVIEHPQFMPEELKTRPDLTLGNDRGRIYRIVSKEPVEREHDSSFRTEPELLVDHLKSPNAWHRQTAFRLLLEHRHPQSELQQERPLENHNERLDQRISRLHSGGHSAETMVAASSLLSAVYSKSTPMNRVAADPRLTEALVRHHDRERDGDYLMDDLLEGRLDAKERDDHLIFQLILKVGSMPQDEMTLRILSRAAYAYLGKPWYSEAIASSSTDHEAELLVRTLDKVRSNLATRPEKATHAAVPFTRLFSTIVGSRGEVESAAQLFRFITEPVDGDPNRYPAESGQEAWQRVQFATIESLSAGLGRKRLVLKSVIDTLSDDEQAAVEELFTAARAVAADAEASADRRQEAIAVVTVDKAAESTELLSDLVRNETDQAVLVDAIDGLGRKSDDGITDVLLDGFRSRTPSVRSAILNAMLIRMDRINRLLDEIDAGKLSPRDIDAATAARLNRSRDADIKARAAKLLASANDPNRAKVITTYQPALSQTGDPQRGFELFKKTCATCHKVGADGTNVGPDISDSRTKTPEFLLTNILDPNRAVDGNYFGYTILDVEGRVHTGIITSETASSVTVRMPEGKDLTLLRTEIEEMANTGLSLMPVGLEKDISVEQMADLISYIKNWRYLNGEVPEEVIGR